MAKTDEVSFLGQHVEKIVFGACVLGILYAIFHWVLSAPERADVPAPDRKATLPHEVDGKLLAKADELVSMTDSGTGGDMPTVPPYSRIVKRLRGRPFAEGLTMTDLGTPRQARVAPEKLEARRSVGLADMTEVIPAPSAPKVAGGAELLKRDEKYDVFAFHGVVEFPRAKLLENWRKKLEGTALPGTRAVVAGVAVQRREVLADGAAGQATDIPRISMPDKTGQPPKPVKIPDYTGKNAQEVRQAIGMLGKDARQTAILQPAYWPVWSDGAWHKWNSLAPWAVAPPAEPGAADASRTSPAAPQEANTGILTMHFHDTGVAVERKYQYRTRLTLVSPLLTQDEAVKDAPDAVEPFVTSQWSEWSAEVSIARTARFFVTGAFAGKKQLTVTVFTQSLGQWVSQKFSIRAGEPIGGVENKVVVNPATAKEVAMDVNFSTGAVAVDLDFAKQILSRTGRLRPTQELVYLENGRLMSQVRVLDLDGNDPRQELFKDFQKRVDEAAQSARTGRSEGG